MTKSSDLPRGATMAPDEAALVSATFMFSTVVFYLHTELSLTNRRFLAARPNTVFGLIPVGTTRSSYPIENIAGVSAGTRFDVLGVIFGIAALVFGVGALAIPGAAIFGVLLVILGVASIVGAPKQYVQIMNSGGGAVTFPVSVFERGRTLQFAARVSEAIAGSTRTKHVSVVSEAPTLASSTDPAEALKKLESLRDQGLLTNDEYASKRREILSRL